MNMVMREKLQGLVLRALEKLGIKPDAEDSKKLKIEYPDSAFGDYSSNAALIMSKIAKLPPRDLAEKIIANLDQSDFEKIEVAGPGFVNFRLKPSVLLQPITYNLQPKEGKILLEYFQPNIAKPLHVGHMRTAVIGDSLKRMLLYLGYEVESETHMGDWGTQFGLLILAYKKFGDKKVVEKDPVFELNKLYIRINSEIEKNKSIQEDGKQEFVKLEKGDKENRKIWKQFVDWSMEKFLKIDQQFDILPFEHHWPESFYEDKMPAVLEKLTGKGLLVRSQGAQIVNLEDKGLGVAIIVKSDGGTTYLLRDLATFIHRKSEGFTKQLYVVDSRQRHTLAQTFEILKMMGETDETEAIHIDYGFVSFKGGILSTRKGNLVLLEDVLGEAEKRITKIIEEKNPNLKDKDNAIKVIAIGALKYFDLKHNRHSDIEFNWEEVLDFEGDSGPYLQYTVARLSSILRKTSPDPSSKGGETKKPHPFKRGLGGVIVSTTERRILFLLSIFDEKVQDAINDYLPNILANYLYEVAALANKFYHESPVLKEKDVELKVFRLGLVDRASKALAQGLDLLGIKALKEM